MREYFQNALFLGCIVLGVIRYAYTAYSFYAIINISYFHIVAILTDYGCNFLRFVLGRNVSLYTLKGRLFQLLDREA